MQIKGIEVDEGDVVFVKDIKNREFVGYINLKKEGKIRLLGWKEDTIPKIALSNINVSSPTFLKIDKIKEIEVLKHHIAQEQE